MLLSETTQVLRDLKDWSTVASRSSEAAGDARSSFWPIDAMMTRCLHGIDAMTVSVRVVRMMHKAKSWDARVAGDQGVDRVVRDGGVGGDDRVDRVTFGSGRRSWRSRR